MHARAKQTQERERPLVVVFVGPAGAGKTTVCDRVETDLRARDMKIFTSADVCAFLIEQQHLSRVARWGRLAMAGLPVWRVVGVGLWVALRSKRWDKRALTWIVVIGLMRAWLQKPAGTPARIVILDEFVEHYFLVLMRQCLGSAEYSTYDRWLRTFYQDIDACFIFMDVSQHLAVQRVLSQPQVRVLSRNSTPAEINKQIAMVLPHYACIKEALRKHMKERLHVLHADTEIEANVKHVKNLMLTELRNRGVAEEPDTVPGGTGSGMKGLFLDRSRYWAGAEQSLAELAAGMGARGCEARIVVDFPLPHHARYEAAGCTLVRRYPQAPFWAVDRWRRPPRGLDRLGLILAARRLGEMVRATGAAIVHVNLLRSRSIYDLRAARRAGAAVIGHLRHLATQMTYDRRVLETCDAVVAISEAVAGQVKAAAPAARCVTIHDAVDTARFAPGTSREQARSALSLPAEALVVTSPGTLLRRKGHDVAIRALARLAAPADVLLVIAGGRPARFDAAGEIAAAELGALAASLGVGNRVMLAGELSDMRGLYAASDVVLALSRDGEAFGRVPAEAGLMERPVVATALGATPELVVDGRTGLLVPPDDAEAVEAALERLLGDPETRERLGRAARAWLLERVSPEIACRATMELYREVLERRAQARGAGRGRLRSRAGSRPVRWSGTGG